MDGSAVVKRYADGFLGFADQTIGFKKGLEELHVMKDILRDNPEFSEFLESPAIGYSEKCQTIEDVFRDSISQETRFFLMLLLKKGRISEFTRIAEYARVRYSHGDEIDVLLKASYPLDEKVIEAVKDRLEKKFQRKLHMYMELDPTLLGGIRVEIGHIIIDGSIQKRIEDIKRKLMAARVS